MKGALISIRPRFAKDILEGAKTAELRRRAPACEPGDLIVVYETAPTMAIVGIAVISLVQYSTAHGLWPYVRETARISHSEYHAYFAGTSHAYAIHITEARHFRRSISLEELRGLAPRFKPPQSWCYLTSLPKPLISRILRAIRA